MSVPLSRDLLKFHPLLCSQASILKNDVNSIFKRGISKRITGAYHTTLKDYYKTLSRLTELGFTSEMITQIEEELELLSQGDKLPDSRTIQRTIKAVGRKNGLTL